MSSQLASLEAETAQYHEQLDIVLTSLKDDPDNAELLALKEELDTIIEITEEAIADLRPKKAAAKSATVPEPEPEKWSRENHPAFKKASGASAAAAATTTTTTEEQQPDAAPASYRVNDSVMAKWVSGDKGFYAARITSVTGSSTNPIYTVKFKSYDTVETLRARDIRPVAAPPPPSAAAAAPSTGAAQKRKADGTPVATSSSSPVPPPPQQGSSSNDSGVVLSAAASLYPQAQLQQAAAESGSGAEEAPVKKFKKIKAKKELEAGKSKWQDFNNKSKFGKTHKKDSMFRTPQGVHGRVGFTGSGQAMRKDPTRSRHVYQANEELD